MAVVVAWVLVSAVLMFSRRLTPLACLVVVSGAIQGPLIAIAQDPLFKLIDEIPVIGLITAALVRALIFKQFRAHTVLVIVGLVGVLCIVAVLRSPDSWVAIIQARQVLLPVGLVAAGFILRNAIDWRLLLRLCVGIALFVASWMIVEEILQAPLMDPTWYYLNSVGGAEHSFRQGLPPSYYSDIGDQVVFRPGGPFFNPPTAGFVLGLGVFGLIKYTTGTLRIVGISVLGVALAFSFARAGILIATSSSVLFWIWHRLGRVWALSLGGVGAVAVAIVFLKQGNTASHANGLLAGVVKGITSIIGINFGTTGYQASFESGGSSNIGESLLGLYVAWLGIPMLVVILFSIVLIVRKLFTVPSADSALLWLAAGMIAAAAFSETASAASATPVLWMLVGLALAPNVIDRLRGSPCTAAGPQDTPRNPACRPEF